METIYCEKKEAELKYLISDFYHVLIDPKGYPPFAEKIREYIEKSVRHSLPSAMAQQQPGHPPFDMFMSSISSAGLGTIEWWLDNGMPFTPSQMAFWAVQLSYKYLQISLDF
jgi:hypothetical protein